MLHILPLGDYGVASGAFADIVAKAGRASSMKGNPLVLTDDELTEIIERAV